MNPRWPMDRGARFATFERAWHNSEAVTFDGTFVMPWFGSAAVRWYVIGAFPTVERLP